MKTVGEVADYIAVYFFYYDDDDLQILKELTAKAITAYAEEKYQQGRDISLLEDRCCVRAEALEEAAKICVVLSKEKRKCSIKFTGHDDRSCPVCDDMEDAYFMAAEKISALKEKP